mgnify:CR=1 FL=1|tara:strand:+ start:135 stop:593 length:459 start_codon:yes stop_codon:yes gene_type:complete
MGNKEFFKYITKTLNKEIIDLILKEHNVTIEKLELFNDFVDTLEHIVHETYLGDDVMDAAARAKHFDWCWKKTVKIFYDEGLVIGDYELKEYFKSFYGEVFYRGSEEDRYEQKAVGFWNKVFNIRDGKTAADMDTLIELYNLFNNSMTNIKT